VLEVVKRLRPFLSKEGCKGGGVEVRKAEGERNTGAH
jgi:hypothetical protein